MSGQQTVERLYPYKQFLTEEGRKAVEGTLQVTAGIIDSIRRMQGLVTASGHSVLRIPKSSTVSFDTCYINSIYDTVNYSQYGRGDFQGK